MAEKDWDLVKWVVVGGLIGAAIGILFARKVEKKPVRISPTKPMNFW